jgi:uncharacterized protein (DUF2267 family)
MTTTGLDVFDKTVQETNHWLKVMMQELETDSRRHAFTVLRATLHALRDRIGPANAVQLGAQLPMLLRGAYYEGWRLSGTPTREHHFEDFLDHIDSELPAGLPFDAADAVAATFRVLSECLDRGEFKKLNRLLPAELRAPNEADLVS